MGKKVMKRVGNKVSCLSICLAVLLFLSADYLQAANTAPMMNPVRDGKQRDCLDCHRFPNVDVNAGAFASQAFCLECHEKKDCLKTVGKQKVSMTVDPKAVRNGQHAFVGCIQCHTDVARSPHQSKNGATCLSCHPYHDGSGDIRSPHLRVQCQACHSTSKYVTFDKTSGEVRLAHKDAKGALISLTDHKLQDTSHEALCERCHTTDNTVGAANSVLPPKSLICIMCHNVSVTMGGPVFWVALILFAMGIFVTLHLWFQGSVQGEEKSLHRKISLASDSVWTAIFSRSLFPILKTIFFDVILQRRLLQESVKRWFIHSLIFLPILFRFLLSIFTFFVSRIGPETSLSMVLINKNSGFMAFTHDLCGILILIGIVLAAIQRWIIKPEHVIAEYKDNLALLIIGVLVVLGFLAESARMLMTQIPPETGYYAFIGYPLSRILSSMALQWTAVYPWLWWGHALVGALLVAYLPFGKMRHIFNTPLTLVLNYKMK